MSKGFRRAVVTGGAGFLGSHLCRELVTEGTAVVCVDNLSTGSLDNIASLREHVGFEFVHADVTDLPDVGDDVDLVMHLASPASPLDYARLAVETLETGGLGTMRVLGLALRCRARFVLASTSEVYGDPQQHPQSESYWGHVNPIGPRSVYDEAKRYAEALTSAYHRHRGLDAGIARIFNSYGPHMRADDGRMVPTFVQQALAEQPLTVTGTGEQTRSLCYVADTVGGLLALAHAHHPGPVNLGNPDEFRVLELAELIRDLAGSGSPISHVAGVTDDPRRRCPDITLARRELGWCPEFRAAEGLRRTIAWFSGVLDTDLVTPTPSGRVESALRDLDSTS